MRIIRDVRRVWHKEQEYNPKIQIPEILRPEPQNRNYKTGEIDTGNIKTGATKPEL